LANWILFDEARAFVLGLYPARYRLSLVVARKRTPGARHLTT
jgi:hypothetical protein